MRPFSKLFARDTLLLLTILACTLLAHPVIAADSGPSTQPVEATLAPAAAPSTQATSAPAAGSSNIVLKEDPTLRIWGMSPRQLLHVSIGAIVVFNILGWSGLIYMIRRTKKQRQEEDAAQAGQSV